MRSTRATITHLAAAIAGSVISFRTSRVDASPARTAAAASTCHGDRTTVLSRPAGRASKSPEQLASLWGAEARRTQRRGRAASIFLALHFACPRRRFFLALHFVLNVTFFEMLPTPDPELSQWCDLKEKTLRRVV